MKILKIVEHNKEELFTRLRKVSMLTAPDIFPYAGAKFEIKRAPLHDIDPAQRYVLRENLERARDLKIALLERGVDIFDIRGYFTMYLEGHDEPVDLLPPIAEVCDSGLILNDGMHRCYMAYLEGAIPRCVIIRDVPKHLPYYAHAIPGKDKWSIPQIVEGTSDVILKKWHRTNPVDAKKLYRNFDSAFNNVGGPRG
jgi:hypothetical protein